MKSKFILLIIMLITIGNCIPAFAASDGDGKNEALDLVESTPADGSKDVAIDTQIKLLFNKNVVNLTVKDNNSGCFRLLDADNQQIPIEVIFADDQMEPDKKREILLKPMKSLKESMTYKVEISPKLQAKNGTSLDKTVVFTFTTSVLLPKEEPKQTIPQTTSETQVTSVLSEKPATEVKESKPEKETATVSSSGEASANSVPESSSPSNNTESSEKITNSLESKENSKAPAKIYAWTAIIITAAALLFIISLKAIKRKS